MPRRLRAARGVFAEGRRFDEMTYSDDCSPIRRTLSQYAEGGFRYDLEPILDPLFDEDSYGYRSPELFAGFAPSRNLASKCRVDGFARLRAVCCRCCLRCRRARAV